MQQTVTNRFRSRLALQSFGSVSAWARARKYNPKTVHAVLSGRLPGTRGRKTKAILAAIHQEAA
jgi:gp16 family phage-associated protein